MNENFPDEEKLYRAVFPKNQYPNFWKKNGKVSSAAFKKKDGLSVERGNFRNDADVIKEMRKFFTGNIISVTVIQCSDVGAVVKYLPTERSIYHSEIHGDNEKLQLNDSQAKHLAEVCLLVI